MALITVLGSGLVGSVIAADLCADDSMDVTIADRSADALAVAARRAPRARIVEADLSRGDEIDRVTAGADVVIGALASTIGFDALRRLVEAGHRCCDICFMPQDALELDGIARESGAIAVVDCGVAPGMSNVLAARGTAMLDEAERIDICVGGLPLRRTLPFQFKAAFSPHDVIEEYTRPARLVENGKVVVREALSEPEPLEFDDVGTLEAFNTDGLRTLIGSLDVPCMRERTLRYPGHRDLMVALRAGGYFDREPVVVAGATVRPLDVTAAVLFPKWSYEQGEADMTVMRVCVEGRRGGVPVRLVWELHDAFDATTGTSSMARTTGFPCAIVARMLADRTIREPGVLAPERLAAMPGVVERLLAELERRGIVFRFAEEG